MRVAVTGDFHGRTPPDVNLFDGADIVLVTGDIGLSQWGEVSEEVLVEWVEQLARPVVAIAGNHDFDTDWLRKVPWTYLENEAVDIYLGPPWERQLTVWGSPMSVQFNNWAHMATDEVLHNVWHGIPDNVDIILVHGPPHGYGDYAQRRVHTGSKTLIERCRQLPNLKLVACGHIHEGYGIYRVPSAPHLRDIRFTVVNGSWVDEGYQPGNPPIMVEL